MPFVDSLGSKGDEKPKQFLGSSSFRPTLVLGLHFEGKPRLESGDWTQAHERGLAVISRGQKGATWLRDYALPLVWVFEGFDTTSQFLKFPRALQWHSGVVGRWM